MNKIFLDIETTGLNPLKDKIIEISCLKLKNFKKYIFHYYINPLKKIDKNAYNIHGISNEFLEGKKKFKDIVFDFLNFIKNSKLIIHNAKFDLNFLNFELRNLNIKSINHFYYKVIDTLSVARKLYKNKKNSLENLCKRFNIDYSKRIKHSAIVDTFLLYNVYFKLKLKYKKIKFINRFIFKKNKSINFKKNLIEKANKKDLKLNKYILSKLKLKN